MVHHDADVAIAEGVLELSYTPHGVIVRLQVRRNIGQIVHEEGNASEGGKDVVR